MLNLARFPQIPRASLDPKINEWKNAFEAATLGKNLSRFLGFERERGSWTSSAFGRSALSFFFFFFFPFESLIGSGWKFFQNGPQNDSLSKVEMCTRSREFFIRSSWFPDVPLPLPRLLKHRCSEILRWRGGEGGGRGWRKRSLRLRGNGIRGKREEETIFNVSVKFHEILNFEYLSGESLGYVITLYREIDIKNMIARVLRIISLRRYFIPYFFSFLFLVFLFFLQFLRRKSNGRRHKRIPFHSTCHYGYNPCEREREREDPPPGGRMEGKDGKGRFPVHDSISEVKASAKWRGVNSGVSPLFIPSNASFGTHHPFFEFHS